VLNALYQLLKVLIPLHMITHKTKPTLWVLNLTWYMDIFGSSLILLVVLVSSGRLLYATRYGYRQEYLEHRCYIIGMTVSFVITIPSSILILVSQINIDYTVADTI
jgi:hypothetical protein